MKSVILLLLRRVSQTGHIFLFNMNSTRWYSRIKAFNAVPFWADSVQLGVSWTRGPALLRCVWPTLRFRYGCCLVTAIFIVSAWSTNTLQNHQCLSKCASVLDPTSYLEWLSAHGWKLQQPVQSYWSATYLAWVCFSPLSQSRPDLITLLYLSSLLFRATHFRTHMWSAATSSV